VGLAAIQARTGEEKKMARSVVRYWEKWGGQEERAMREIVSAFNESQDRFLVEMEPAGDWSSSPDLPRFLAAQSSGNPPDLIGLEDHQIVDLAREGVLVPVHPFSGDRFLPAFERLGMVGGTLYGLPVSANVVTLYVNLKALPTGARARLPFPTGIDAFDELLRRIEAEGRIGMVPSYPGWWPQIWPYLFGGAWFRDGVFEPEAPANLRAYRWVAELAVRSRSLGEERFSAPVNPIGRLNPDPFISGQVAMVVEGDWVVRRLVQYPDLEWVPAPLPSVDGRPQALIVADVLCIPRGARNREGAQAYIDFASRAANIEALAIAQNKISPLRVWSQHFIGHHPNPQIVKFRDILMACDLVSDPRVPGWLGCLERVKSAFQEIWSGKKPPQEALALLSATG
jgi:multiple sugar transport system substrate-binding protein